MIDLEEIEATADQLGLSAANVQRDYVFGWLISGLYASSSLAEQLVLKGGNALRKGYFPATRFSDDLDFTTERGLDATVLLSELSQVCEYAQARSGVQFDLGRNQIVDEQVIDRQKRVYKVRLYFKDFATGSDHITLKVRVDVTEYDRIYLPVQTRRLIHQYSDADQCNVDIRCVKLEEALADKMKCLLQRRYCYDLFDLVYGVFINREIEVDRPQLMDVFLRKTIFQASPIAAKRLLVQLPLDLFRGFWSKVVCPASTRLSFDTATQLLVDGLESLFAPFGSGDQMVRAFFPPELRNPILQAGADQKLVQLTYHGYTRHVEPYSLAFKRRKDGVAQEYFYAYDRTGGQNGPGIKAFLNTDIQNLQVLDETFTPQFPIELSKAGDSTKAGYFTGGNLGGGRRPSTIRRSVRPAARYVIQCRSCGRQFPHSKPGVRLRPHADGYGNRCPGRSGYRVV